MAAGLIMVAHRSGGPLMDIVVESEGSRNGFLAADETEYAQAIATILRLSPHERKIIRDAARYNKSLNYNTVSFSEQLYVYNNFTFSPGIT
jgi:alpha-1,2-mannosyltransferase